VQVGTRRTDARRHDEKVPTAGAPHGPDLARRRDDAVEPRPLREPCQAHDLLVGGAGDADLLEVGRLEARQHGDAEDLRLAQALGATHARHVGDGALHHRETTRRVDVEHADAEPRRLDAGGGDRVRDVVELEVEEDVGAARLHHADDVGAGVDEELLADLVERDRVAQPADRGLGRGHGVDVEADDQSVATVRISGNRRAPQRV
jgi:hypothetical protein